jgi:hypothetical protein
MCGGGSVVMKSVPPKGRGRGTSSVSTTPFTIDGTHHTSQPQNNNIKNKLLSDLMRKFEQDMATLTSRLSEIQGIQIPQGKEENGSLFVTSLRHSVENHRQPSQENELIATKHEMMEQLLQRVVELDRAVLKKTEITAGRARRASRGADLFNFPTHLLLIDRLVDLHAIAQRSMLRSQSSMEESRPPSVGTPSLSAEATKAHEAEVRALVKQLSESTATCQQLRSQLQKSTHEIEELRAEVGSLTTAAAAASKRLPPQRSPRHTLPPSPAPGLSVIGTSSTTTASQEPSTPSSGLVMKLEAEVTELKCRLEVAGQRNQNLEEHIDHTAASTQQLVMALLKMKHLLNDPSSLPLAGGGPPVPLLEQQRHRQPMVRTPPSPLPDRRPDRRAEPAAGGSVSVAPSHSRETPANPLQPRG